MQFRPLTSNRTGAITAPTRRVPVTGSWWVDAGTRATAWETLTGSMGVEQRTAEPRRGTGRPAAGLTGFGKVAMGTRGRRRCVGWCRFRSPQAVAIRADLTGRYRWAMAELRIRMKHRALSGTHQHRGGRYYGRICTRTLRARGDRCPSVRFFRPSIGAEVIRQVEIITPPRALGNVYRQMERRQ